jgi:hypothetical protein
MCLRYFWFWFSVLWEWLIGLVRWIYLSWFWVCRLFMTETTLCFWAHLKFASIHRLAAYVTLTSSIIHPMFRIIFLSKLQFRSFGLWWSSSIRIILPLPRRWTWDSP